MAYTRTYFKKGIKNKILLWIYRRLNGLARWFMYRCDHYDCNKCIHHYSYGCMRDWFNGDCLFGEANLEVYQLEHTTLEKKVKI